MKCKLFITFIFAFFKSIDPRLESWTEFKINKKNIYRRTCIDMLLPYDGAKLKSFCWLFGNFI